MHGFLPSQAIKASVASTGVAAVRNVTTNGTFLVLGEDVYTLVAVVLALVGVLLAREVSINDEAKRNGTRPGWRETGPLTWIGVLIVCPFIWHFQIAIPWASLIGLGTGYSVRVMLRIFGNGTAGAARALVRHTLQGLEEAPPPRMPAQPPEQKAITDAVRYLDQIDDKSPPAV